MREWVQREVVIDKFSCGCGACDHKQANVDGFSSGGLAVCLMEKLVGRPVEDGETFLVRVSKK